MKPSTRSNRSSGLSSDPRHVAPPDITPTIRQWFVEADFVEFGLDTSAGIFAVGACQFIGRPAEFQPGIRLFDFLGYDKPRRCA
jgi:hypothetical protein